MTVEAMQKFDARGVQFYEHFKDPVDNAIWTWKDAFVLVKQRCDHFSFTEAKHFYEIQKADSTDICKAALSDSGLMTNGVLSLSSVRKFLGLYTLVYRSPSDAIIDVHPDFVKNCTSEQQLFVGI